MNFEAKTILMCASVGFLLGGVTWAAVGVAISAALFCVIELLVTVFG